MMECIQKRFSVNYNSAMNLAPNASRGFAMAGLLVAMSVMAILMSVALPTWSRMVQREKEEELIFRGNQYARAINLYQRKFANASPATLDVLIEQHFLRKKYKDPLAPTKDGEFQLLYLNNQGTSSRGVGAGTPGSAVGSTLGTKPSGGIVGVASKNTGTSIRVFKGKTKYNEWQFVGVEQTTQAGAGAGAGAAPGQRGTGPQRGGTQQGGRQGTGAQPGGRRGSGSTPLRGPGFPP
jgi:type II secretory pathway pseudopilin PulG